MGPELRADRVADHIPGGEPEPVVPRWSAIQWAGVSLAVVAAAFACHAVALSTGRVLDGADLTAHYRWLVQFHEALTEGTIYPRWMSRANGGLGEPAFVILHPGWYYVVSAIHALGVEMWLAMRLAGLASTVAVGLLAVWFLLPWVSPLVALAVAISLQALPLAGFVFGLHAALPWHFSFALVLFAIGRTTLHSTRTIDVPLACCIGMLCFIHLLVAFMVLVSLGGAQLWSALRHGSETGHARLRAWVLAVGIGVGTATAYWLLALTSGPLFNEAIRAQAPGMDWRTAFALPVVTSRIFGTRWGGVQWVLPVLPALATLAAWMLARRHNVRSQVATASAARMLITVSVLSLFLASELSYPLYATLPLLENVQFPYRFLTVASVASFLALGLLLAGESKDDVTRRGLRAVALGMMLLSVAVFALLQFRQMSTVPPAAIGPKSMEGLIGYRTALPAAAGPYWQRYVEEGRLEGYCKRAGLVCLTERNDAHHRRWLVEAPARTRLLLPVFAFPAWAVAVDGRSAASAIDRDTGVITVDVAAGRRVVTLDWHALWQQRVGSMVSLVSLALLAGLALNRLWRRRVPRAAAAA